MQWALKSWRSRRGETVRSQKSEVRSQKSEVRIFLFWILDSGYWILFCTCPQPLAPCPCFQRRPSRLPSGQLFFPDIRYPLFWFDSLRQILVVDRRKSSNKPVVRRPFWIFCRKGKAGFFS